MNEKLIKAVEQAQKELLEKCDAALAQCDLLEKAIQITYRQARSTQRACSEFIKLFDELKGE